MQNYIKKCVDLFREICISDFTFIMNLARISQIIILSNPAIKAGVVEGSEMLELYRLVAQLVEQSRYKSGSGWWFRNVRII